MSNAESFLKKAESDKTLQAKLVAVGWKASDVLAIAAQEGYSFTADELQAASNALYGELSDSALDNVAGGASGIPKPNVMVPDLKPNIIVPE